MGKGLYILDRKKRIRPVPDTTNGLIRWARWLESSTNRVVCVQNIAPGVRISTVFLGLDHAWNTGAPVLWESMVFIRKSPRNARILDMDKSTQRCTGNWEQAEAMHVAMVKKVTDYLNEKRKEASHRRRKSLPPGLR